MHHLKNFAFMCVKMVVHVSSVTMAWKATYILVHYVSGESLYFLSLVIVVGGCKIFPPRIIGCLQTHHWILKPHNYCGCMVEGLTLVSYQEVFKSGVIQVIHKPIHVFFIGHFVTFFKLAI